MELSIYESVMNADKKQYKGEHCYQRTLKKVIPQAEPCVQFIDLDNQQATGDCRLNKNMKLLKQVPLDHIVFLPKCTESHHGLKAEALLENQIKAFQPTSPRPEKQTTSEPQTINHS